MTRITEKQLQGIVNLINRLTQAPEKSFTKVDGKIIWNIGNYHLSFAYGGVSLHRIVSTGGGVSEVFGCGHVPKRELAIRMYAFTSGLQCQKGNP